MHRHGVYDMEGGDRGSQGLLAGEDADFSEQITVLRDRSRSIFETKNQTIILFLCPSLS